ncbi:restriction endonuclease subunit S [Helicobacter felis]|uniref:restriction endonuclease subunit S n=1 Tax=Helicobacter felis TaxID=214 RepID=UPI000CF0231F|nr:restriction endonuclease subunit S [Helicobacter felis]
MGFDKNNPYLCGGGGVDVALSGLKWQEFRVGELFHINTPKRKFDANKVRFCVDGYPYVARGANNNGIRGYIDEDPIFLNEAPSISFGQDTATIFYQDKPYFTGDKIKVFTLKEEYLSRYRALFLITCMRKAFSAFSWGSTSFKQGILENLSIKLPTHKDGTIAYDLMEHFIKALEKQQIEKVMALWDQRLKAYEDTIYDKN